MLIDVHAHFHTDRSGRADWRALNQQRVDTGDEIGIDAHVASILGTWGATSPTYFPSSDDVTHANQHLLEIEHEPTLLAGLGEGEVEAMADSRL